MEIDVPDNDDLDDVLPKDVTPPIAPNVPSLEKASWQNVVSLLETQNSLLSKKLENLEPTLSSIQDSVNACKEAASKCAASVDKLEELKATIPDDVPAVDDVPPVDDVTEQPAKKQGLFTRKSKK